MATWIKCEKTWDLISTYHHQQQQANAWFHSVVQMEGWEPGLPSIIVHKTTWLRQRVTLGSIWRCPAVLLSSSLVKMTLTAESGFRTTSVWDKFMTAGLNACWASGFPPHSPACWNIYGENNLMSWKKEIMSYKTADCHKDSPSSGSLEFLPLTCRDKLSGMEMAAVQYFTCLMKWK